MGWTVSALSVVIFGAGALCATVGVVALRRRPNPMAWPLAALMFAGLLWTIPHGISFGAQGLDQVVFWNRLIFPGASLVPVAYLVLALRYAGHDRWLSWRSYALLCLVPLVTVAGVFTNPTHGLFWESVALERVGDAATLDASGGPLLWLNLLYSYLLIVLSWGVFAGVAVRTGRVRKQAVLMLIGGVVPTLFNAAFNSGVGPLPAVDLTSAALGLSGAAFAVALFRYDLVGLTPAAYQSVPDLFADGIVVFDEQRRLVDANEHAEAILDTPLSVDTPAEELFDEPFEELDETLLAADGKTYSLRRSSLENQRGDLVGHALVMREVTELREHQQRLSVTNRVLRHNLRNELNIILGVADQLEPVVEGTGAGDSLDRLRRAARRLGDVSEKARHIQTSLELDERDLIAVDAAAVTEQVVDDCREQYPEAEIRYDRPGQAPVLAAGTELLATAIRNVVENGIEHNDRDRPTVDVSVGAGETVTVQVADDGPGIPAKEYEVLGEPVETQLKHGSSLGLWLTYWLVAGMGGALEFDRRDPRGTVVTLRLQTTGEPPEPATETDRVVAAPPED